MGLGVATAKAGLLKALAHPLRISIVEILEGKQMTAAQIAEHLGMDSATISSHLVEMKNIGFVQGSQERGGAYGLEGTLLKDLMQCVTLLTRRHLEKQTALLNRLEQKL